MVEIKNKRTTKKKKTIWDNLTNPLNCYSGDQHNLVERKLKIIIKLNSQPNPMLKSETGKKSKLKKIKKLSQPFKLASRSWNQDNLI